MNRLPLLFIFLFITTASFSQKKGKTTDLPAPVVSSIAAKVAGMKKYEGYFEFYYDEKQDKVYLHLVIIKFEVAFVFLHARYFSSNR